MLKLLAKLVLESANIQMMAELVPENNEKKHLDISEHFKNIVKEQGNNEGHDMFMITDTIQSQTWDKCETLGHKLHMLTVKSRSK